MMAAYMLALISVAPSTPTARKLIKAANDAAMTAGVTITSPSYDSGPKKMSFLRHTQPAEPMHPACQVARCRMPRVPARPIR
jgi:hypothetical protein